MTDTKLLVACYRALLRWSNRCKYAPLGLTLEHIQEVCPSLENDQASLPENLTLGSLVRWQFRRREANPQLSEGQDLVESSFAALRLLNTHYEPLMKSLEEKQAANRNRQGIMFQIGEVVEHKKHSYCGVVTGWDSVCEEVSCLEDPDVNLVQPFYRIVADDSSMTSQSCGTAWIKYLPQDVLRSMKNPDPESNKEFVECFVGNAKLEQYFCGYSSSLSRYIPHPQVQWEYPDNYHATDVRPFPKSSSRLSLSPASASGATTTAQKSKARRRRKSTEDSASHQQKMAQS